MTEEQKTSEPTSEETEALAPAPMEDDRPFMLSEYLMVNIIFLGFLALIHFLLRKTYPDGGGITVFFVLTGIGFILVSVYDFAFDRLSRRSTGSKSGETA